MDINYFIVESALGTTVTKIYNVPFTTTINIAGLRNGVINFMRILQNAILGTKLVSSL